MNPYQFYATDVNLESGEGVKLQYPGFSITIHRAGGSNKKFANTLQNKMKPHRQRFERGMLDDETSERIMLESYAEAVVIGWDGVTDQDGKPLEFTTSNVIKIFTDLPDLYADIKEQARNIANFRAAQEENDIKN